jgi:uncharacterized protein YlbG (UPF0298 family)
VTDLRLGPRTLETACQLIASVAVCCAKTLPLLLIDDHLPYPAAILQVFGQIKHRRKRKKGRGRKRKPTLKPLPNLLVNVVRKIRNSRGRLQEVTRYVLFGRLKDIERRIRRLKIVKQINVSHLERLDGTLRGQQTRLARRTRNGSRLSCALQWSLWLWRDLYHWVHVHGSLNRQTRAVCVGLAQGVWTLLEYICYPVHVSDLLRCHWAEQRQEALQSPSDVYQLKNSLPIL